MIGMMTFVPRKKTRMFLGFLTTFRKLEELMPKAPLKVRKANSHVTEGFIHETRDPRMKPTSTPSGVMIGIRRSRASFSLVRLVSMV
jgi:hypothetical protein